MHAVHATLSYQVLPVLKDINLRGLSPQKTFCTKRYGTAEIFDGEKQPEIISLLNHYFIDHFCPNASFTLCLFFLSDKSIHFLRDHMRGNDEFITDDLQFFSITGNGLSHDLFPGIFDLQCLYTTFDPLPSRNSFIASPIEYSPMLKDKMFKGTERNFIYDKLKIIL